METSGVASALAYNFQVQDKQVGNERRPQTKGGRHTDLSITEKRQVLLIPGKKSNDGQHCRAERDSSGKGGERRRY